MAMPLIVRQNLTTEAAIFSARITIEKQSVSLTVNSVNHPFPHPVQDRLA
jgi:hypothetical protein